MANPVFLVAVGTIDGINDTFFTPTPYTPGSLAVFLNGILLRKDFDNGWLDVNPATGEFQTKDPPLPADTLQVFYRDTAPSIDNGTEVSKITGKVRDREQVSGSFRVMSSISGDLKEKDNLSASIKEVAEVKGTIRDVDRIIAIIKEC